MDVARLLRQTILVEHVTQDGPDDEMGDPTEDSSTSSFRGYVWQENSSESTAGGVIYSEVWRVALVRSAAGLIDSGDRITVDAGEPDEVFEVAGPPWIVRNPRTNLVEFVTARLERTQ